MIPRTGKLLLPCAVIAAIVSWTATFRTPAKDYPGDLYAPWCGTRVVLHRQNPYSTEVSRQIQTGYYGHVLGPTEKRDQQRFVYPIYTTLLLWPLALMTFKAVWMVGFTVLLAAVVGMTLAAMSFVGWPLQWRDQLAVVFFVLSTATVLRGLRLEQLLILVALFLVLAMLAIRRGHYILGGILLSVASIKPQMALIPIVWAMFWSAASWSERKRLTLSFAASMGMILVFSEIWLPGWMVDFVQQVSAYHTYANVHSSHTLFGGELFGGIASALLCFAGGWFVWLKRDTATTSRDFIMSAAVVLAIPAFVMPTLSGNANQILLLTLALVACRDLIVLLIPMIMLAWVPIFPLLRLTSIELSYAIYMSAVFVCSLGLVTMLVKSCAEVPEVNQSKTSLARFGERIFTAKH